jgi:poly(A) polymerase
VPPFPLHVLRTLRGAGHEAWLVGGCVRDLLLGREPKDWDVVTSALPDAIEALFPRSLPIGKAFGIITVVPGEGEFPGAGAVEVATFRAETTYADGRHPDPGTLRFTDAREDVLRRDFTVNALLLDPAPPARVCDWTGGRADLEARTMRAIGDPVRRFSEDRLRMLRAVRFAATLGFGIDPDTFAAIRALAPGIHAISAERIRDELVRTFTEARDAGAALDLLDGSGLLREILPEVAAMHGVEQPPEFHPEGDVYVHTRLMLSGLPQNPSPRLALAVLLHDVGKPPTARLATLPDGTRRWRFESHASVGEEMARGILSRLRCPNALVDDVAWMVGNHMRLADAPKMRTPKLRRMLAAPTLEDELVLHHLDCVCSHGDRSILGFLNDARARFAAEPVLPPPLVMGRDLVAAGLAPGPTFKPILQALYDLQLEGETDKAALLARIPDFAPLTPGRPPAPPAARTPPPPSSAGRCP